MAVIKSDDAEKVPSKRYSTGELAKATKYLDRDGKISDKPSDGGSVLVAEGDEITDDIAARLK